MDRLEGGGRLNRKAVLHRGGRDERMWRWKVEGHSGTKV